jgi:hypothetical protein
MRYVSTLLCLVILCVSPVTADPGAELEKRARTALAETNVKGLRELAAEYRRLTPDARRELTIRVREDAVEFAFRGDFHGDQFQTEMLEYLASEPGRNYETLVVVIGAEADRLKALGPIFHGRPADGRRKTWSARLVWTDGGNPHAVDVNDLLLDLPPAERDQFLDRLNINAAGLGGSTNVKSDPGVLPRKRVPACLYLTVRLVPKG